MIEIIITAFLIALFNTAVIVFFNALLDIYDRVIKIVKKAIKIIRVNTRNNMAKAGVISRDWYGNRQFHGEPNSEPLNIDELPGSLREKVLSAVQQSRRMGEKYCDVEVNMSESAENMIRLFR